MDEKSIQRIAAGDLRTNGFPLEFPDTSDTDLVDDIATMLNPSDINIKHSRNVFLAGIIRGIIYILAPRRTFRP